MPIPMPPETPPPQAANDWGEPGAVIVTGLILAVLAFAAYAAWHLGTDRSTSGDSSPYRHPVDKIFSVWLEVADDLGLTQTPRQSSNARDPRFEGPKLVGTLEDLDVDAGIEILTDDQADPDSVHVASTTFAVRTAIEIPFPFHRVSLDDLPKLTDLDAELKRRLDLEFELSGTKQVGSVETIPFLQKSLKDIVTKTDSSLLQDGRLCSISTLAPSRNPIGWRNEFAEILAETTDTARTLADTKLRFELTAVPGDLPITVDIAPDPNRHGTVDVELILGLGDGWPSNLEIVEHRDAGHASRGPGDALPAFEEAFQLSGDRSADDVDERIRTELAALSLEFDRVEIEDEILHLGFTLEDGSDDERIERLDDRIERAGGAALEIIDGLDEKAPI